jgi:hypothetical protein
MLNSAASRLVVSLYAVDISIDTHVLENVRVPKFSEKDARHRKLAELVESAHIAARGQNQTRLEEVENTINGLAASIWGLGQEDSKEISLSLQELSR